MHGYLPSCLQLPQVRSLHLKGDVFFEPHNISVKIMETIS
jgi:hypothetical protein